MNEPPLFPDSSFVPMYFGSVESPSTESPSTESPSVDSPPPDQPRDPFSELPAEPVSSLRKLPRLANHIRPLTTEDSMKMDSFDPGNSQHLDRCLTCGGAKTFRWHACAAADFSVAAEGPRDVVEYECPCVDQWILHRYLTSCGVFTNYQRLSQWDVASGEVVEAVGAYLEGYLDYVKAGIGMILHGGSGTGKTLTSVILSKGLISHGVRTYFLTFADMVDRFASGWKDREAADWFYRRVKNSTMLVIDDIGKEMKQGLEQNIRQAAKASIDEVLRFRVSSSLPTILTTNYSMDDLSAAYGMSVFSLLQESSLEKSFSGRDYRPVFRGIKLAEVTSGLARPIVL